MDNKKTYTDDELDKIAPVSYSDADMDAMHANQEVPASTLTPEAPTPTQGILSRALHAVTPDLQGLAAGYGREASLHASDLTNPALAEAYRIGSDPTYALQGKVEEAKLKDQTSSTLDKLKQKIEQQQNVVANQKSTTLTPEAQKLNNLIASYQKLKGPFNIDGKDVQDIPQPGFDAAKKDFDQDYQDIENRAPGSTMIGSGLAAISTLKPVNAAAELGAQGLGKLGFTAATSETPNLLAKMGGMGAAMGAKGLAQGTIGAANEENPLQAGMEEAKTQAALGVGATILGGLAGKVGEYAQSEPALRSLIERFKYAKQTGTPISKEAIQDTARIVGEQATQQLAEKSKALSASMKSAVKAGDEAGATVDVGSWLDDAMQKVRQSNATEGELKQLGDTLQRHGLSPQMNAQADAYLGKIPTKLSPSQAEALRSDLNDTFNTFATKRNPTAISEIMGPSARKLSDATSASLNSSVPNAGELFDTSRYGLQDIINLSDDIGAGNLTRAPEKIAADTIGNAAIGGKLSSNNIKQVPIVNQLEKFGVSPDVIEAARSLPHQMPATGSSHNPLTSLIGIAANPLTTAAGMGANFLTTGANNKLQNAVAQGGSKLYNFLSQSTIEDLAPLVDKVLDPKLKSMLLAAANQPNKAAYLTVLLQYPPIKKVLSSILPDAALNKDAAVR